jgi:hypothetical protein
MLRESRFTVSKRVCEQNRYLETPLSQNAVISEFAEFSQELPFVLPVALDAFHFEDITL